MFNPLADQKGRWQGRTQVKVSLGKGDFYPILAELPYNGTIDVGPYDRMAFGIINPYAQFHIPGGVSKFPQMHIRLRVPEDLRVF